MLSTRAFLVWPPIWHFFLDDHHSIWKSTWKKHITGQTPMKKFRAGMISQNSLYFYLALCFYSLIEDKKLYAKSGLWSWRTILSFCMRYTGILVLLCDRSLQPADDQSSEPAWARVCCCVPSPTPSERSASCMLTFTAVQALHELERTLTNKKQFVHSKSNLFYSFETFHRRVQVKNRETVQEEVAGAGGRS